MLFKQIKAAAEAQISRLEDSSESSSIKKAASIRSALQRLELAISFKEKMDAGTLKTHFVTFGYDRYRAEVAFGIPGKDMSNFHPRDNSRRPEVCDVRVDEIREADFTTKEGLLNFQLATWQDAVEPSPPGSYVETNGTPEGFHHEYSLKSALNIERNFFGMIYNFFTNTNTLTLNLFESELAESEGVKLG